MPSIEMIDLCLGQSGAMNYGTYGVPAPAGWVSDPDILVWNASHGAWETYTPGVNAQGCNSQFWGPEAEFLRRKRAARPDIKRRLVKLCAGGVGVAQQPPGVADWNPLSDWSDPTKLWSQFYNMIGTACGALPTYHLAVNEHILVVNGETDATSPVAAAQFAYNMQLVLTAIWQRFQVQNAHVVMSKPSNAFTDVSTPYLDTVRAACDQLALWDSRIKVINVDDLIEAEPYKGHLDAPSTTTQGSRMADAAGLP